MGVMLEGRNMLRVCLAWCNSRSQRFNRKEVSAQQRITTKLTLNIWIAFSALFLGWNELVCHVVGLDGFFEIVGTFVVEDMLLGCNSGGS